MILNHWYGSSVSLGNTAIFLWQDLQSEFLIVIFHSMPCKALVISQVFLRGHYGEEKRKEIVWLPSFLHAGPLKYSV